LTLTKYVGEKGKVEQAICSLRKDETFLDSTNCFVAAESWRLSCAPNPNGIVYRYIPKEYYITAEQSVSSTGDTHHNNAETDEKIDVSDSLIFNGIMTSKEALEDRQQLNIMPREPDATQRHSVSVNLDTIVTQMMKELNPHRVTKGSKITLENSNNDAGWYILKDDPLAKLQGPGFGPQGLSNIYGTLYNSIDYNGAHSPHPDVFRYIELEIDKKYVPGMTKLALQEYFSRGIAFWRPSYANTPDTGDPNNTLAGKLPYFHLYGPIRMQTSIAAQSTNVAALGEPAEWVPNRELFCKSGHYTVGNTVYNQTIVNGRLTEVASTILDVRHEIVSEQATVWHIAMTGYFSATGLADHSATGLPFSGVANNRQYRYYAYRNLQLDPDHNIYHLIKSVPKIQSQKFDNNGDIVNTTPADSAASTAPILYHPMSYKRSVTRRATTDIPVPTYTPNDFMQWWNSGFGDQQQPYVICTSPNGGWRLVVLADNISSLTISKKMCDDMGLLNYMVTDGIESEQIAHKEKFPVVVAMTPDDDINPWVWNWSENYSKPTSMLSRTETREISEFIIVDHNGVEGAKLQSTDVAPQYLREITTGYYFRLVAFNEKSVIQTNVQSIVHEAQLRVDGDGNEVYMFTNPGKGSYLDNDQTVSIGSFSLFESIRLIVPSGISFSPMISSHSDARILCELRLPFQNTAEIQQGFLKNEPVVTSTESAFYGDIIWNNPPSGLQYLPLTTQGGIYDFEIAAELIARDPNVPPQRVYLGYTDIFQVKLRFINRN